MTVGYIITWLNTNAGAAQVVAAVVVPILGAIGWIVVSVTNATRKRALAPSAAQFPRTSDSVLDRILATKTLRVALLEYSPLMSFSSIDHRVIGHGIYPRMLSRIARDNGLRIEWSIIKWSDILNAVDREKVDIIASIFWTPRRSEHAMFCGKMHRIGVTGVVRKDEMRIVTHEDLKQDDIRVGVVQGEIGWEYAIEVLHLEFNSRRLKVLDQIDIASAVEMVEKRLVDVFLADSLSCWSACHGELNAAGGIRQIFVNDALYVCENGFMIKRDEPQFRDWLDVQARALWHDPKLVAAEKSDLVGLEHIVKRREP